MRSRLVLYKYKTQERVAVQSAVTLSWVLSPKEFLKVLLRNTFKNSFGLRLSAKRYIS
jgi:hypothetical protein